MAILVYCVEQYNKYNDVLTGLPNVGGYGGTPRPLGPCPPNGGLPPPPWSHWSHPHQRKFWRAKIAILVPLYSHFSLIWDPSNFCRVYAQIPPPMCPPMPNSLLVTYFVVSKMNDKNKQLYQWKTMTWLIEIETYSASQQSWSMGLAELGKIMIRSGLEAE